MPRYDEELRDASLRMGGHIEESEHLGWGAWVVVSCICVVGCCLSEYRRSRGVSEGEENECTKW